MPVNKVWASAQESVADVRDGATILVGGFGGAGSPSQLLEALALRRVKDLTVVSNNAGNGNEGLAALLLAGSVKKICCSYPISAGSFVFNELYAAGELELELIPQGTLSERIRAGGAGIGGFYTRTGIDTLLTEGKETRQFDGENFVFERPIRGDVALVSAKSADRWGNLVYSKSARNFGPTMAMAADLTIAEVDATVDIGGLDPEAIITPGIFVDRVVNRS